MDLAGVIDMGKSSQVLGPDDIKCIFVKGQEESRLLVFNPSHEALVEGKAPEEQPGQGADETSDNVVPGASGGKQTSITDFFPPSPTSSVDVPRSFATIRAFTRARSEPNCREIGGKTEKGSNIIESGPSESSQLTMRDEEDEEEEEEERMTPKETWRLNLVHLHRTVLFMSTTRFQDACGAAFMLIFTISSIIYGIFYLVLGFFCHCVHEQS